MTIARNSVAHAASGASLEEAEAARLQEWKPRKPLSCYVSRPNLGLTTKGKDDTMETETVTQMPVLRQSRKTTHVRCRKSDVKVLNDIVFMLNTINPGVGYKHADAINCLIWWALQNDNLPKSTPKDLYTGTE